MSRVGNISCYNALAGIWTANLPQMLFKIHRQAKSSWHSFSKLQLLQLNEQISHQLFIFYLPTTCHLSRMLLDLTNCNQIYLSRRKPSIYSEKLNEIFSLPFHFTNHFAIRQHQSLFQDEYTFLTYCAELLEL